jgi:hypothetical protein
VPVTRRLRLLASARHAGCLPSHYASRRIRSKSSRCLKSGGQLAIIDFEPAPGSALPEGVPANRSGHGIPPDVLIAEITAAGFVAVKTLPVWPPDSSHDRLISWYLFGERSPESVLRSKVTCEC